MAIVKNRAFQIHKDVNGYPSYLRTLLVPGDLVALDPFTEQMFIIPPSVNLVLFSKEGGTLYTLIDDGSGSIVLPAPGSFIADSLIDINVVGVTVTPGDTIHLLSPIALTVKINYFKDGTIQ